jgi:hypothetical protein
MKRVTLSAFASLAVITTIYRALGLSVPHPDAEIFFPKGYNSNRVEQIQAVLCAKELKYLGGLTRASDFFQQLF